jgi:hypothetical protein
VDPAERREGRAHERADRHDPSPTHASHSRMTPVSSRITLAQLSIVRKAGCCSFIINIAITPAPQTARPIPRSALLTHGRDSEWLGLRLFHVFRAQN